MSPQNVGTFKKKGFRAVEINKTDYTLAPEPMISRGDIGAAVSELVANMWGAIGTSDPKVIDELQRLAARALTSEIEAEVQIAMQQERIAELESLAITDELTGALNRRGFQMELDRTLANAKRYDEHGVVICIDLDGFKQVNDTYGHAAGDAVLVHVTDILRENTRATDFVGRLGGDEFCVLLTRTTCEDGLTRAEVLEERLNASSIVWEGRVIPVRGSFGFQTYAARDNAAKLLNSADEAMYKTKKLRTEISRSRRVAA